MTQTKNHIYNTIGNWLYQKSLREMFSSKIVKFDFLIFSRYFALSTREMEVFSEDTQLFFYKSAKNETLFFG